MIKNNFKNGSVFKICIAKKASSKTIMKEKVNAIKGMGIEGDRYSLGLGTWSKKNKPHQQISLIESENIDSINLYYNNKFNYGDFRRNIITKNIKLNNLVGNNIWVGKAKLKVIKLRHPCLYLANLLKEDEELIKKLRLKGGIVCEIIRSGTIKINDKIIC